jgi:hypothetical protein
MTSVVRTAGLSTGKIVDATLSGLGLIFTLADVYFLMKEWKNRHPSLKDINELIIALKNDIVIFETIFNIINNPNDAKILIDEYKNKNI